MNTNCTAGRSDERLQLVAPRESLAESFLSLLTEFRARGETLVGGSDSAAAKIREPADVPDYIAFLRMQTTEEGVASRLVPSLSFWLVRGDLDVVGVSALRLRLTPALAEIGGHVGYSIRPSVRGQGYGTRILAFTLDIARARGIDRALLTCDRENVASARVIERNGGVLLDSSRVPGKVEEVLRYAVDLTHRSAFGD